MSYTATRGGETVLSGGAPAAEGSIVELIPVFGDLPNDDEPAPVVWVNDASDLEGVDLEGAYVIAAVAAGLALTWASLHWIG